MPRGSCRAGTPSSTRSAGRSTTPRFGGAFIYTMADDIIDIGLVVGLDYKNPNLEPHALFQRLKTHSPRSRR